MTPPRASWLSRATRPAVVLPLLALTIVLVALVTPEQTSSGRGGLSSNSAAPEGSRVIFELAQRLGWHVQRRVVPFDSVADPATVQVVIGPTERLGAGETHRLLEHVRRGGALIGAMSGGPLLDSLHVSTGAIGRLTAMHEGRDCGPRTRDPASVLGPVPTLVALVWRRPPPSEPRVLATIDAGERGVLPSAVGIELGRGRIALAVDPDFLRNDVVRVCRWEADLAVVRMLDYVRGGSAGRTTLTFDEDHHGFGIHPGSIRAISSYLAHTASGHVLVQVIVAGLLLLVALSPRPIVPRDPERIARRSPLEHADALAHALAEVGGTRTAAARLVDGVRRRVRRSAGMEADNEAFLRAVALQQPALAADGATLRRALEERIDSRDLAHVGDSLRRVEQALTPTAWT